MKEASEEDDMHKHMLDLSGEREPSSNDMDSESRKTDELHGDVGERG